MFIYYIALLSLLSTFSLFEVNFFFHFGTHAHTKFFFFMQKIDVKVHTVINNAFNLNTNCTYIFLFIIKINKVISVQKIQ